MTLSLTLVGCGKMGSALLSGWLKNDIVHTARIIEPQPLPPLFSDRKEISHFQDLKDLSNIPATDEIFILAVKPQIMKETCNILREKLGRNNLVLSIAAGQSLSSFQNYFGKNQPIIRTMPNIPASIGKGITVACASLSVTAQQKEDAQAILRATGKLEWIEDESLMDSVTALSGSGPAYFFYLTEVLARSGEKLGLSKELSLKLARETFIGSAALAENEMDITAETLRKNVTSSGGSTEAALHTLMQDKALQNLFDHALNTAKNRNKELGK